MIRNPKPVHIAFLISLLLSTILGVVSFFMSEWEIIDTVIIFTLCFGLSFFLFFYTLEFFIYRKIKLIYKTIHSLKTQKYDAILSNFDWDKDPIGEMNKEVIKWARDNKMEIDQLKRLADFRKEFLGNVSHELKTPIFNIQGYIHTLLDGALDDPQVNSRFLKKAAKSADRLSDLVADLLAISQLESGELTMEFERFDITSLVKDVYEQFSNTKVQLLIKEGCNIPFYVYADRYRIRQVLVNLISNSIKYGKENGITAAAFYDMDENILIEISDNGTGIDKEHLNRIFERFYRIDKSRTRESQEGGTGLGLAIVKHILEAHRQSVNVRSSVGEGTTFGFTLKKSDH
ncbi:MAG: cell wall metabolism sensor histidine kinase WalK [Bacteroidia bacterium]|nr:cell wall metabolism sensor histidine kinase WalK [Bacteroidia bacterium]MCF8425341.1 cell wall metabolism sensor histidine kinase WalK [Bacteroidia bacterium]MCF8447190.1 cell wall metabolism sensor histidine kinase WalK [Bacteroidia bacterium]